MDADYTNTFLSLMKYAYVTCKHHVHVTTITWIFETKQDKLNIKQFYESFDVPFVVKTLADKRKKKHTDGNNNNLFYNQVTLEFSNFSTKSIKIFKNGKVHITGLSSLYECYETTKLVLEWLQQFICVDIMLDLKSQRIAMINVSIHTSKSFKLKQLQAHFNDDHAHIMKCSYYPDNYPALKLKFSKGTSAFVFHTGNIIMSNSCIDALYEDYKNMMTNFPFIETERVPRYNNKYPMLINGYHLKDFMSAVIY
jgi:TATA-box binding protein (TBP) (component of TFIID and TFIIIB)